jgi:hypothetical protein
MTDPSGAKRSGNKSSRWAGLAGICVASRKRPGSVGRQRAYTCTRSDRDTPGWELWREIAVKSGHCGDHRLLYGYCAVGIGVGFGKRYRALPRADPSRVDTRPERHGYLAGFGGQSRIRQRLWAGGAFRAYVAGCQVAGGGPPSKPSRRGTGPREMVAGAMNTRRRRPTRSSRIMGFVFHRIKRNHLHHRLRKATHQRGKE